ncbi:MAG: ATP-binding cassette domain-containing protein [Spirochaetaceae bacterium]|nr:ATP-binding cassette domain-containing protein [Spirochaetaceae bacterium]
MDRDTSPVIEMRNVSFNIQSDTIIKNFSYQFNAGVTSALTGEIGSGKSTILKLAAGILVPDTGDVFYRKKNIATMSRKENLSFRRESAFVFQNSALWANQTVFQTVDLPLRLHFPDMKEQEQKEKITNTLAMLNYQKGLDLRPDKLSMGEQKLIGFARGIICCPDLLFLDEWIESLDDSSADRLLDIVKKYKAEHKTIIFVSHDISLVKALADCILIINNGELSRVIGSSAAENHQ